MCKFLRQLKLCSITNRWEPFTRRAGASIGLEGYNTPGLAPHCGHPHTRFAPGAAPRPRAGQHRRERRDPCPNASQQSPAALPSSVVPMLLPNAEEVLGEHLPPVRVWVPSAKHHLCPKPPRVPAPLRSHKLQWPGLICCHGHG